MYLDDVVLNATCSFDVWLDYPLIGSRIGIWYSAIGILHLGTEVNQFVYRLPYELQSIGHIGEEDFRLQKSFNLQIAMRWEVKVQFRTNA